MLGGKERWNGSKETCNQEHSLRRVQGQCKFRENYRRAPRGWLQRRCRLSRPSHQLGTQQLPLVADLRNELLWYRVHVGGLCPLRFLAFWFRGNTKLSTPGRPHYGGWHHHTQDGSRLQASLRRDGRAKVCCGSWRLHHLGWSVQVELQRGEGHQRDCASGCLHTGASYIACKGDPIANLQEDLAAEQKARATYEKLINLCYDDPDVLDPLRFLRQREVIHFQRFGEALNSVQEKLAQKRFYQTNNSCMQNNNNNNNSNHNNCCSN